MEKRLEYKKTSPMFIDRNNIVKMAVLLMMCRVFAISINIPTASFTKLEENYMESQNIPDSRSSPEQNITLSHFKLLYRVAIIKAVWYWHKRDMIVSRIE